MPNLYAKLSEVKGQLGIADANSDARLLGLIEDVSRWLDGRCKRYFYVRQWTRTTDVSLEVARRGELLLNGDLLTATSVLIDLDGDMTPETALADTDFYLDPPDTYPKHALVACGDYGLVAGPRALRITGMWGYGDGEREAPWDAAGVTLTLTDSAATSAAASAAGAIEAGQTILVDNEQLYVSAVSGTTLTVTRAINGTTAAAHAGTAVSLAAYPRPIARACIWFAEQWWLEAGRAGLTSENFGDGYAYRRYTQAELESLLARLVGPCIRHTV